MKYLDTRDLTDISNYCKSRCNKAINEHNKNNIKYYKGKYKGYMYGVTIVNHLTKNKIKITDTKLYQTIKEEKLTIQNKYIKDSDLKKGLIDSLYELMNYVSTQQ